MKRVGGLFERAFTVDNLDRCIFAAAKGKRYKRSAQYAINHHEEIAKELHDSIYSGNWSPPDMHYGRLINDGVNIKKRIIVCPEFVREQVVHHAIVGELQRVYLPKFYRWSCGSVPARGQEGIAEYYRRKFSAKKFRYVAKLDIHKCFDSINTSETFKLISRSIKDKRFLDIVNLILRSNTIRCPDGTIKSGGIPIGFYTSPWFANVILDRIDHILKDRYAMAFVVRFMDDIIIFHSNKRKVKQAIVDSCEELKKYGLRLKHEVAIHPFGGRNGLRNIRFCGMRFHSDGSISLRDRIYIKGLRCGRRIRLAVRQRRRISAYNAARMLTYAARFKAFGTYRGFVNNVLVGKIKLSKMRDIISKRDKLRNGGINV